ncbi:MAG: hypothetical protein AB1689_28235 [Thermodesulfobacteriota bacterium]
MQIASTRQRLFVAGQQIEFWEHPDLPFGCALNDLETYCLNARWELLFNAMVLAALALQEDEEEQTALGPTRFAWAVGTAAAPSDEDVRGH